MNMSARIGYNILRGHCTAARWTDRVVVSWQKGKGSSSGVVWRSQLLRFSSVSFSTNCNNSLLRCNFSDNKPRGYYIRKMSSTEKKPFERLPSNVKPYHYEITLTPDLSTFTFVGKENVHIDVIEPTAIVKLNTLDVVVNKVVFHSKDGKEITANSIVTSNVDEITTVGFPEALPQGKSGYLFFDYAGEINDKMKGLYRSKCIGPDKSVEYAAVTQFESTDARRCFPCWDEPACKATFDIILKVKPGFTTLSNMPIKSKGKLNNEALETVVFEKTPIMSTYLVAVVVGHFDYIEDKTNDGVVVRVYTLPTKQEQGRFALEVATKVLQYYHEYFGIKYPLPKLDLIAISDFACGAMENWGLVTYRESYLVVDPENTSAVRKQWIALIVGHELGHQWFGNLVTMEWWTHLWLNEGYASFAEFLCVAHLFPEYDIWTQFVTNSYIRALELDALQNSHPIEVEVGHPSEIDEIFDDISYEKGSSVIRMLHSYLGDDDFRKGMNLYLTRHSYKNTQTDNLWTALEEASKKPVGKVMSTWTQQQGFPVIKVEQRQNGDDRILTLTQQRFFSTGSPDHENRKWMIPICISTSKNPNETFMKTVMSDKTMEITLPNVPEGTWVKLNPGTVGFYRTCYSSDMLSLLLPSVKDRSLPPLDRLGLVDDLFAMVQSGHTPTVEVLRLMQAYQHEDNYTVWSGIINGLSKIGVLISHLDFEDSFKEYGRALMRDVTDRLGWEKKANESHSDTLLRSLAIGRMSAFDDSKIIEESKRRFALQKSGTSDIPADLRTPIYRAVVSAGDAETFETVVKMYRETDLQEERERILRSLGAFKDDALLKKVLEFAMSEDVRPQDTTFTITAVASSYQGRLITWNFFKQNYKTIIDYFSNAFLLPRLIKCITENFATEEKAAEIKDFFEMHPTPIATRTIQQSIETIKLNAAWLERDVKDIKQFLTEKK